MFHYLNNKDNFTILDNPKVINKTQSIGSVKYSVIIYTPVNREKKCYHELIFIGLNYLYNLFVQLFHINSIILAIKVCYRLLKHDRAMIIF